jgi:hypothetical protein
MTRSCGTCRFGEATDIANVVGCGNSASQFNGWPMGIDGCCEKWAPKVETTAAPLISLNAEGPWPDVVQFLTGDGTFRPVPPLDGRAYRVCVMPERLADYEELARSGRLYKLYDRQDLHEGQAWVQQAWRIVLGLPPAPSVVDEKDVGRAYRLLARERHPDAGGSHESMVELVAAYEAALRDIGYTPSAEWPG